MTSASTNQIELIRGDVIPLDPLRPAEGFGKRQKILQREYVYSSTQRTRRYVNRDGKKQVMPYVCHEGRCVFGQGEDFWPMFCTHATQDWRPLWALEFEGEECALHAAAAGYVAFSHPGHNHSRLPLQRRYGALRSTVCGLVYVADKDAVGRSKAEKCAQAADDVRLPFVVVHAGDVLEGLPAGGSIDDVEDVGAAIELILEAARSAQQSTQTTCAEPAQLAAPSDPPKPPAQPSAQHALKQVGKGRDQFTLDMLLPKDVADAATVLTESLNYDPLSVAMPFLTGISALVKLGTRIKPTPNFSTPPNIYLVVVAPTGSAKSGLYQAVVKGPAELIIQGQRDFYVGQLANWKANKSETKGPEPGQVISQIEDYTPARLDVQLQAHEKQDRGILLMSDEVESIFRQASGDAKNGSGRGETQLLELFDGYGHTTIRMSRDTTSYKRCAVSLIGGIQPDKLRELIDPRDVTGQMARCLFLSLPDTLITPSLKGFTQDELRRQEEARLMLSAFVKHVYDLPKAEHEFCQAAQRRFYDWFIDYQVRAKRPTTEPIVRALWMKSAAQLSRLAGVHHIVNTQGSLDRISDERVEIAMAVIDQLFAETVAFHLKPTGLLDRLMERFRAISTDPEKCPGGRVSWKRNRNHLGRDLRDGLKQRQFNEALALLAETEGRLIEKDPPVWQR